MHDKERKSHDDSVKIKHIMQSEKVELREREMYNSQNYRKKE